MSGSPPPSPTTLRGRPAASAASPSPVRASETASQTAEEQRTTSRAARAALLAGQIEAVLIDGAIAHPSFDRLSPTGAAERHALGEDPLSERTHHFRDVASDPALRCAPARPPTRARGLPLDAHRGPGSCCRTPNAGARAAARPPKRAGLPLKTNAGAGPRPPARASARRTPGGVSDPGPAAGCRTSRSKPPSHPFGSQWPSRPAAPRPRGRSTARPGRCQSR